MTCADGGPTCPAGWQCTADNQHCFNPEVTLCGNGEVDQGEQCDDGNLDNHDGCNWDCKDARCGDGFVDGAEVCDDGNVVNGDGCSADCASEEVCGDGYVNGYTHKDAQGAQVAPEQCDDGVGDSATCNADCTNAFCGDGKVNPAAGEACDGGNPDLPQPTDTDTCNKDCSVAGCGDAYINVAAGEQCDNGLYCADGSACATATDCVGLVGDSDCVTRDFDCCTRNCQNPLCGDGVVQPDCVGFPLEVCDKGRFCADFTPCLTAAQCAGKGDGECKTRDGSGCSADCLSPEVCGDAYVNSYSPYDELCDDGRYCADLVTHCTQKATCTGIGDGLCAVRSGTGCSDDCASLEVCGDGYLNDYPRVDAQGDPVAAEACDDGKQCADGTPCTASSQCVGIGAGNCKTRDADKCSADCLSKEVCGDHYVNTYLHTMVNAQPTCVPLLEPPLVDTCPAVFQGLTTVGEPFLGIEACDDGNVLDGDGCSSDCLSTEKCGDGYLNDYPPLNEICDDGNNNAGDGCAPDCKSTEQCGNSFTDPGEECDDGPLNGTDVSTCSLSCAFIKCNNARKDPGEQCDEGVVDPADPTGETVISFNSDTARCLTSCVCNICGDQLVNGTTGSSSDCVNSRFEECDSGGVNTDTCNFDCTLKRCGDGITNFVGGERCDNGPQDPPVDGQTAESATCNTDCSQAFCGDGKLNRARGEVCDDGNNTSGDGCSADCKSEEVCGDAILNAYATTYPGGSTAPPEACDLGRFCADLTTACSDSATCAAIVPALGDTTCVTRDGVTDGDGAHCSADCLSKEACGDRYVNAGETCDDGNAVDGDGCGASCQLETGWACVNSLSTCKATCDAGDPTCQLATSYACLVAGSSCAAVCGDGLIAGRETCDDGTQCESGTDCTSDAECVGDGDGRCAPRAGDGCDATCEAEAGWSCPTAGDTGGACLPVCGDLRVRPGETCDDGNAVSGDGCDASCQTETGWDCQAVLDGLGGLCTPICGDGITRGAETCDDGDLVSGNGCSDRCTSEIGWSCPAAGGACAAVCGDFVVRGAETCDDGTQCQDGTPCDAAADCAAIGDGTCAPRSDDGCDASCHKEAAWACPTVGFTVTVGGACVPICGDGLVRGSEACDDSGRIAGDGCDSGCQAEVGWDCPFAGGVGGACTPTCGDGLVRGVETCDEGTATASGGCTACVAQAGWACPTAQAIGGVCTSICGDGLVRGGEECDNGTLNDNRADCTLTCRDATCSDGFVHALQSGTETDVDCGGATCAPCVDAKACLVDGDCASNYCEPLTRRCEVAPTPVLGDDSLTVLETSPDLIADVALQLLSNDSGYSSATLTVDDASSCGTAVASGDLATVVYTLPGDPSACPTPYHDSFTYTLCSPFDAAVCATATAQVTINRRPTLGDAFSCVPVGRTRTTLDVAPLYLDADGDPLGTLAATGTAGLATVAGGVVTWAPDDRDAAASYAVSLDACDNAEVSGCAAATWTAVWDDPPTLGTFSGGSAAPVTVSGSTTIAFTSLVTDTGVVAGQPAGSSDDPIASVMVSATQTGTFAASAATSLGSCAVDAVTRDVTFTAGATPGSDHCYAQVCEVCGTTPVCAVTELEFSVVLAPSIAPSSVTLAVNNTVTFSGTSGIPPYAYAVFSGAGTVGAATGVYTAPASAGAAVVRLTDSVGSTSDASVTINAALAISPPTVTLAVGNTTTFSDTGGVGPFAYSVLAGGAGGAVDEATGLYTAPVAVGSGGDTVRVTDSLGNTSDASVTVNAALAISPTTVTLAVGNTTTFSNTGGVGPFAFTVLGSGAGGTVDETTGLYTAPSAVGSGSDTVRVTDSLGNTSDATVVITEGLAISPTTITVEVDATTTFSVNGGVGAVSYTVVGGGAGGAVDASTGEYTAPSATGTDTVRATDSLGNTSDATVTVATVPDPPTAATATPGNEQALVTWTAPAFDGGVAITGYTVTSSPDSLSCTGTDPSAGCVVTGLTNGAAYTFTVTATNEIGTGLASAPSVAVTPATLPDAPTGAAAVAGDASATVTWTAPGSDGGSAITEYTATSSPDGLTCTGTDPSVGCVVSGLTNGAAYTFTVTATNAIGTGVASDPTAGVTPV
ncbi:MAG: hypothetical protein CVU56_27610, partial [Deltaproteobacteria bacterium HGW-Deltaproteobacteria-14]